MYSVLGKDKPYNGYERNFQKHAMAYLKMNGYFAIHVPNGGVRSLMEAKLLKADGVLSGVSDVLIFNPKTNCRGVAIELKVKGGRVSESQDAFLNKMSYCGWSCFVVYSHAALETLVKTNKI